MLKNRFIKFFTALILSIFSLNSFANAEVRIVQVTFVGNLGSGKTYFRKAVCGEKFSDIYLSESHTTNTEFQNVTIPFSDDNLKQLQIKCFDTSGDSDIKSQIIDHRVKDSHFVVITVDSTKSVKKGAYYTYKDITDQNMREWYDLITEKYPECFVILLGTKTDTLSKQVEPGMKESKYDCFERKLVNISNQEKETISYVMGAIAAGGYSGINEFFEIIKERIREINLYDRLPSIDDESGDLGDYNGMQNQAHPKKWCLLQ